MVHRAPAGAFHAVADGHDLFYKDTFASLAKLAFGRTRDRQPILDTMLCKPYQSILSELDLLSGLIEHTAGAAASRRRRHDPA